MSKPEPRVCRECGETEYHNRGCRFFKERSYGRYGPARVIESDFSPVEVSKEAIAAGCGFLCPVHGGRYETYCTLCPVVEVSEPPSLKRVVERFLDNEFPGILNECQRKHIAREIEFQWELVNIAPPPPKTEIAVGMAENRPSQTTHEIKSSTLAPDSNTAR